MIKKFLLLCGLIMIVTPQVFAQGIKLGPQVGYQKAGDADNGKLMFGGALRLKLSSALGVEGSINYRQEKFADDALTVRSWPIMVSGLFYPLPIVYGAIGAGWYNTTFDFDQNVGGVQDETKQEFGWHFGAGVELPIGGKSRVTGDIRYVFLDYDFGAVPFSDVDSNFFVITGGFLFGL